MEGSGSNFTLHNVRKRESQVVYVGFTYKINGGTKEKKRTFDINNDNNDNGDF
jgi:hypothetical protein